MTDPCTEFLDQLERFLDGECGPDVQAKVEEHMRLCPPCEHRAGFEERLRAILRSSCRESAPPDLVDSIMKRLDLA